MLRQLTRNLATGLSPLHAILPQVGQSRAISQFCRSTSALLATKLNSIISHRTWFDAMDQNGRGETAKHGYGVTLYDPEKGERTGLKSVEMRFKRLDWGQWIRTRAGRNKKAWKKSGFQLRQREKHVFCARYHKERFDRAVLSEVKEIRHIPNDPYKPYNDLSFQNYHSIKLKNMELIKKYGPKIYDFPWFRAHFKKNILFSDKYNRGFYEPPGYHKAIGDGEGVYSYDPSTPQNIPAPDYILEERMTSTYFKFKERKYWRQIRRYEAYTGSLSPSHVLKLPVSGTRLG